MTSSSLPARPANIDELRALEGNELGPTSWREITQGLIDSFAKVTGDHQWIHVDPGRAAGTELGGTIAHGLLTLSLAPALMEELLGFEGFAHSLNYGYEKVRFPSPVPVGSRLRLRATVTAVAPASRGVQVTVTQVMEIEGAAKPGCVAEAVARLIESD